MKRAVLSLLFLAISVFWISGCHRIKLCRDIPLEFPLENNFSNKLKLNGYYLDTTQYRNPIYIRFFYTNGITFYFHSSHTNLDFNNPLVGGNSTLLKHYEDRVNGWGKYIIKGDSILIESWDIGRRCPPKRIERGVILNDSTFVIRKINLIAKKDKGKGIEEYAQENNINYTCYFKSTSQKLDSTNRFIP